MTDRKRRTRLTDAGVARLKPGRTEYIVWDSWVAGLGVRVRPSGHRSFVWHWHADGAAMRETVGPAAVITVEDARRECRALQDRVGPDGTIPPPAPLFRDFVLGEWRFSASARWGTSRRNAVDRTLRKQLLPAFGARPLDRIGQVEVERWFDAYSRTVPNEANNALQVLRQILNAAIATGLIAADPTKGIRRNPRSKLTRFLSAGEIERLHRALDRLVEERPSRMAQADIVRLLLLTGCRKGEIQKLKWSEVDEDALRLERAKTGPRTVWLSDPARAILARQPRNGGAYVFPSPADPSRPRNSDNMRTWELAREEAGIEDVRVHDLRHTVASQAVARGVALSTVARMLGHADPRMTLRYAHVRDPEVEAAAERIGTVIEAAMAGAEMPDAD